MKLKHWVKGSLRDQHAEPVYGCHMASARKVTDLESQAIAAKIEELGPWFHNYEIAAGVWTNPSGRRPGIQYPLDRWRLIEPLLPDVTGKSCLDVGCSSGFFSLKLKELGAAYVLGLDSEQQPKGIEQAKFAAELLCLDVDFRLVSAYDMAALHKQFDIVLFMGVFYHLRHPLVALEAARAVCRDTMIFQTITARHQKRFSELHAEITRNVHLHSSTMAEPQFPAMSFVENSLDDDITCWFVPNLQAVAAILRSCGFQPDQMTFTNEQDIIMRCKAAG